MQTIGSKVVCEYNDCSCIMSSNKTFDFEDLSVLFGEDLDAIDEDFFDTFLSTFLDERTGEPSPKASRAIPLRLSAFITCFDGIPPVISKLSQDLFTQEEFPFLFEYKVPIRAMIPLVKDTEFNKKFAQYVYQGQKKAMVQAGSEICNCCGDLADDLVAYPVTGLPDPDDDEGMMEGPVVSFDYVFPVCGKMECVKRLYHFAWKVGKLEAARVPDGATLAMQRLLCAYCNKEEITDRPKLKKCPRCENFFHYCSKKCQKEFYKKHKKTCEPKPKAPE